MDDRRTVAVAGTARAGSTFAPSNEPFDRAVALLDSVSTERSLLLAAGAHAIRRRAGVLPLTQACASTSADVETWDVASDRAALLIGEVLSGQSTELLPEALERLRGVQILIPHALLPSALDAGKRNKAVRPALLAAIGERGSWLARHNGDWAWAAAPSDDELAENADTVWQEGNQANRLDVLRLVRSKDAERGRALLESTWIRERASFRAEAIDVLRANLSGDDQSFLEAALEDRAIDVRARAEELLLYIPGSRPAREAESRADEMIGTRLGFQIAIRPPEIADAKDVIQAFSRVRPSHWITSLDTRPADLAGAIVKDRSWGFSVLDGLTKAAVTFGDQEWAAALCSIWFSTPPAQGNAVSVYAGSYDATANQFLTGLLQVMQPAESERAVCDALAGSIDPIRLPVFLPHLACPWSADFTDRFLRYFHDHANLTLSQSQMGWHVTNPWSLSFRTAVVAFPRSSISNAIALLNWLQDRSPLDGSNDHWDRWKQLLQRNIETLQMRLRIHEEIHA